ncbi:ATP-dependent helicase HrpB [Aquibaculum sediminis]|uniref:ATP-dependent helicase HrpB n=1 Tax=Aquibaculum sediminis TaxID=3231907 RepID=UPI0034551414
MTETLPIEELLPALRRTLADERSAVVEAPPGAGKTTLVPLALLEELWLAGQKILMLEPRRLAARAAAARMASLLGEVPGQRVGYRTRLDSKVGRETRIEVVTEGILTRRLQSDPGLDGVGLVIFDEFHERSLQADLGLALCLEVQALRDDLRLLVMSATLDGAAVAALLGEAPRLTSAGRQHPVSVTHLGRPRDRLEPAITAAVRQALREAQGDLLVFLPGEGEIRRCEAALTEASTDEAVQVLPLYGALPPERQDAALRPAKAGRRKVILATAIAETSLTIEGVRVVIDSGLARRARFDPASGMTRLETGPVSRAAADQRRGRAGRTAPGHCYRLWSAPEERALPAFDRPEILDADLAPLALELAAWGLEDAEQLAWLDPPPAAALAQARDLLSALGALDADGRITEHGRAMNRLSAHPRLAHMLLSAEGTEKLLACDLAALLSERDILKAARDADLRLRLDLLREGAAATQGLRVDRGLLRRCRQAAAEWRRRLGLSGKPVSSEAAGRLLALAYPERLGQARSGRPGSFRLANGRGAVLRVEDPLSAADWLAVAHLDGAERDARIFLAAPLTQAEIEAVCAERIEESENITWNERSGRVEALWQRRIGALVLERRPLARPAPEQIAAALLQAVERRGMESLPWSQAARQLQARVALLRRVEGEETWPDLSDAALARDLATWLQPYLHGMTRLEDLQRLNLAAILTDRLDWPQRQRLDSLAPTHLSTPSGRRHRLDYCAGDQPVLAVKLQEMFGAESSPSLAGGRVPVLLHLLSPAGRPLQVTGDLRTFWREGYREVRAEMRGRYPKHPWPEDPLTAPATARAKPRR